MYKNYQIIVRDTADQLAREVNSRLDINNDYQPIGRPFFADGKFHQAIGIYVPEEIKKDCLHFLGDEAQMWHAHKEGHKELIEVASKIFERRHDNANQSLKFSELEGLYKALKKCGLEFSFPTEN